MLTWARILCHSYFIQQGLAVSSFTSLRLQSMQSCSAAGPPSHFLSLFM